MSSSTHSKMFENVLAAADSNELLADLDQRATVLAENSWPKRDHPAPQTGSCQPQTAHNIVWKMLFKCPDTSQISKEQKDKFIANNCLFAKTGAHDHLQASSHEDWNQNQPYHVDLNGRRSYNRPWGTHDPPSQAHNYDRSENSQSWNHDREQEELEQKPQPGDVLMTESQLQGETQQSGEWPDPGGQAECHEEHLPELRENDESDSDSDSDSDNESSSSSSSE
jgi:hypothetical protein